MKGSRNVASLSKGLHEGVLEGRLPYWGTLKICKALEMGVCFHRALLLGNMEARSYLNTFKKKQYLE
jgi:hypothetical protein